MVGHSIQPTAATVTNLKSVGAPLIERALRSHPLRSRRTHTVGGPRRWGDRHSGLDVGHQQSEAGVNLASRSRVRPRPPKARRRPATVGKRLSKRPRGRSRWRSWSALLWRVFGVVGFGCPKCGHAMQLRTLVMPPATVRVLAVDRLRIPPLSGGTRAPHPILSQPAEQRTGRPQVA